MSRLIVISNRVQVPKGDDEGAQGGLAVALFAALRRQNGIWFGWSGETGESRELRFETNADVTTAVIDLSEQDVEEYYNGYANRTLWPLFHYRLDMAEHERDYQGGYQRVNRSFSEIIAPHIEPDDLVWVHDYHLIPLGSLLRERGVTNRIGFFLHIPWPPKRLLTALPEHQALVETLFAYDMVGFQTEEWLDSFRDYVTNNMEATIDGDRITVGERTIRAIACPIGIDAQDFVASLSSEDATSTHARMVESSNGRDLIVGVDRLDYSKGLQERFTGYERFLSTHPERAARVYLLQIAPPTREAVQSYRDIRAVLNAQSGLINGTHADIDWVPLRYVNRGHSRSMLGGIYRAARIGLVTPLRDGMNLVAKEYIAAQDPDDPGVLILSQFAGAAAQLDQAILVNPYSADDIAEAIERALSMPREERIARWRPMFESVMAEDVTWWLARFIDALKEA
ncbi:MAG: trehalose-6-phosphate synthase [Methylobacterium sp.]|nr:MAG: trehalose-6-phosphate synthase [Methylobacterium sp.]